MRVRWVGTRDDVTGFNERLSIADTPRESLVSERVPGTLLTPERSLLGLCRRGRSHGNKFGCFVLMSYVLVL